MFNLQNKELLSKVLGLHIYSFEYNTRLNNLLFDFDAIGEMRSFKINIYELANKYKEFIYKNTSLAICSIVSSEGLGKAEVYKSVELIQTFNADTEAESIFKACEWIYNNKNKYSIIKEIK